MDFHVNKIRMNELTELINQNNLGLKILNNAIGDDLQKEIINTLYVLELVNKTIVQLTDRMIDAQKVIAQ